MCDHDHKFLQEKPFHQIIIEESLVNACYLCGAGAYMQDDVRQTIVALNKFLRTNNVSDLTEAYTYMDAAMQKAQQYSGANS